MPGRKLHQRSAFTLIEVLVVVSIIGLLLAIMIPSLARSRENARSVVCRSNLKEWGNAMFMYANVHRGTLPFEDRPDPVRDVAGDRGDKTGWACWFDALDRYLGSVQADEDVKICPTVHRFDPGRQESYRMNSKLAEDNIKSPHYYPFRRLDTLKRPGETVMLFDGDVGGGTISFKGRWRLSRNDDVSYRHNRAANLLFADWHAENLKKNVLKVKSYDKEKYDRNEPDPRGSIIWLPAPPPDLGPWHPDPQPSGPG